MGRGWIFIRRSLWRAGLPPPSRRRDPLPLTDQLLALVDWLIACGGTHVAMEATGVYWKPVVNVLESYDFSAVLMVNLQQIRGMRGRKTDVQDVQWIASLLRMGVLKGSDISPRPQRDQRELVRYRTSLVQTRDQEAHPLQKVLEGANIKLKLSRVISGVLGVSGQRILAALAAGESEPQVLARLAGGRIRASEETVTAALHGSSSPKWARTCSGFPLRPNSSRGTALARASTRMRGTRNPPGPARVAKPCRRRWWRRGRPPWQEARGDGHGPPHSHRGLRDLEGPGYRLSRPGQQLL